MLLSHCKNSSPASPEEAEHGEQERMTCFHVSGVMILSLSFTWSYQTFYFKIRILISLPHCDHDNNNNNNNQTFRVDRLTGSKLAVTDDS